MMKFFLYALSAVAFCYAALFIALQIPLVNRSQPVLETQPISQLARPDKALTFAAIDADGIRHILLVTAQTPDGPKAIDLSAISPTALHSPFDAVQQFGHGRLVEMATSMLGKGSQYAQADLLPAASGTHHIAFGTNFLDHGEEVNNETPFRFPRKSAPTASVTSLQIDPTAQMIDYEVEICMSFDRPIASLEEFDRAGKMVFLCGDFTDRKLMLDGMPDNEETISGIGFTDAKSLPGFFPTGPFMVIPQDWRAFVAEQTIGTTLNGASMQITKGDMMIEDFRSMVDISLGDGTQKKWTYKNDPVALLPTGQIETGQVLLSGTTSGVLYRPPSTLFKVVFGTKYALTGRFLQGQSAFRSVVSDSIQEAIKHKIMLMPGDVVVHHSSSLGSIVTSIR